MTLSPKLFQSKRLLFWLACIGIILVAALFRFYRIADYPLGLFFDPAINGLDAVRLMQRGGPVFFFPTNGGREALFMGLLIPFIDLFGTTPLSIRALTATISLLTVVLLIAFLRNIEPREAMDVSKHPPHPTVQPLLPTSYSLLPLLAGFSLAVLPWHIAVTRLGQRPILVPLFSIPIFWFFLKGWQSGQKRWFVMSGLFMGLEGYTYSAARLLPIILVLALLPEFLVNPLKRSAIKRTVLNLSLFLLTALVVYSPMAWYLLNHPAQFTSRAFSVMVWNFLDTPTDIITELGRNAGRVLGFFCCSGSPNPIFGYPGYPGLSFWLTPALVIGLIIAIKHWRDFFHRLVALWWLVGVFASIVAIEAPHPLRMIVAMPPTAILTGMGLLAFMQWLHRTMSKEQDNKILRAAPFMLPLLFVFLSLPGFIRAYYINWGNLEVTQGIYDYNAIAIRNAILDQAEQGIPLYLPQSRFNDSTLLYYLSAPFPRQAKLSVPPANTALAISPDRAITDTLWIRLYDGTATVLPPLTTTGQQLIQSALADPNRIPIQAVNGDTAAYQILLPNDPAAYLEQPEHELEATFGPLELIGATFPQVIDPQADLPVTLYWQNNQSVTTEYEILVRLITDARQAVGNGDARPTDWVYPTSFWRPGIDQVAAQHLITFNPELEPGRYWLAVSVFDPALGQRLPLTEGFSDSPDTFFVGPLKIALLQPPTGFTGVESQPLDFGELARLIGYKVDPTAISSGDSIQIDLLWEALSLTQLDYTIFVHLLDEAGNLAAGSDSQPMNNRYPTSIWDAGEQILDTHTVTIPSDLPAGQYRLAIGIYFQPTGERLPLKFHTQTIDTTGRLTLPPPIEILR
ncbi:MAG: hypothetical protein KDJ52_08860 [Anaerolineae bacterium]|nr:hypothetical protein [Anaerolineae bacterium]